MYGQNQVALTPAVSLSWTGLNAANEMALKPENGGIGITTVVCNPTNLQYAYEILRDSETFKNVVVVGVPGLPRDWWLACSPYFVLTSNV